MRKRSLPLGAPASRLLKWRPRWPRSQQKAGEVYAYADARQLNFWAFLNGIGGEMAKQEDDLRKKVANQARRMKQADRERPTLLAQTVYMGTLGLLFVLPVVIGAYLGHWLDSMLEGYSMRWTLSLIAVGIALGGANVYLFVKE